MIDLETHGFDANLLYDEHGLSPYWGFVSVFEPERSWPEFDAAGQTWSVDSANYWKGKLAPPDDIDPDSGLYEYSITLESGAIDQDLTLQFRPGIPDAEHIDTGEPINGMPDDCPESIRVQVIATNVDVSDLHPILRSFADEIGLNPDYFGEPHERSRVTKAERYARLDRDIVRDHVVGQGGIINDLVDFARTERGRGMHKWDHEEIVGHYQSVAADADTLNTILPSDDLKGMQLKAYHPANPRSEGGSGPLSHPKVEGRLSQEYSTETVPWSERDELLDQLDEMVLNALSWSGIPLATDADHWIHEDVHFRVADRDRELEIVPNPLPELREQTERHVESELVRSELSDAQEQVLTVLSDGGSMHYEELADQAGVGTSTVYRLVEALRSLIETDQGLVQFADNVTRRNVRGIVDAVRETAEWASQSIREVARDSSILSNPDDPLRQWLDRHGIRVVAKHPDLELELDRPVSRQRIRQIMRAGVQAAEGSAMLSERLEDAKIHWQERDGGSRRNFNAGLLARNALSSLT